MKPATIAIELLGAALSIGPAVVIVLVMVVGRAAP